MADDLGPAAVERAAREYAPDPVSARDVVAEATDTLAGWLIGSGYYATSVGVDEARGMADALAAAGLLAVTPGEVPALAEIEAAYCETSGTDDERRRLRAELRAWLAEHDAQVAARAVAGVVAHLRRLAEDEVSPLRPGQWRFVAEVVHERDRIERQEEGR